MFMGWRRSTDGFIQSLALTLACYLGLAWAVVYIRELRHSLPFAVWPCRWPRARSSA